MVQRPPLRRIVRQFPHILRGQAVLHELGDGAFYLMNITLAVQIAPQSGKAILQPRRHFLQHQTLTCVVQHGNILPAHLLQNAMGQTAEAEHINVHNTLGGVHGHQFLLGLHGKLIRHHDHEVLFFPFHRPGDNLLI